MSQLLEALVHALAVLPGVGPRSARRMAHYLLYQHKEDAQRLAHTLLKSSEDIQHCQACNNFADDMLCHICSNPKRDERLLCVVEMPMDVYSMEQSQTYQGKYFVLMGRLSPLDRVQPQDIAFASCLVRAQDVKLEEVILATSFTTEGEVTAHYLNKMLEDLPIKISRLASGIPSGSELEYVDTYTIAHALMTRHTL